MRNKFISNDDRKRVQTAAKTKWGRLIVEKMRSDVEERRTHTLTIPTTPAGHSHKYFCPIHNTALQFDWDKPHEHFCKVCGKYYQGEQYDRVWVNYLHQANTNYLRNCTYLSAAMEEPVYRSYIRQMLLDYADKYANFPIHGREMEPDAPYGARIFSQSLDESFWADEVARAYAEAVAIIPAEERKHIEEDLLRPCAEVIRRNRADGNWQAAHNAALASIAAALDDRDLLNYALNAPDGDGYYALLHRSMTADGWWNEGSPTYHFLALRAMASTAEAARGLGINLWDDSLKQLFITPLSAAYPDLTLPAHNDGWHGVSLANQTALYEMAALRYPETAEFKDMLKIAYLSKERNALVALLNSDAQSTSGNPLPMESALFPASGVAVLRDGTRMAVLKFGEHGGLHGHNDKLSLALHDGHREILPDLGTCAYGVPDYAAWYRHTVAHNTVAVDKQNQEATSGTLISFNKTASGGMVVIRCDTAYPGISMERKVEMKGGSLTDHFGCSSTAIHIYDYVLLLPDAPAMDGPGETIELGDEPGYARIRNARRWKINGPAHFQVGEATLTVTPDAEYEIISGEAPGIPGSGLVHPTLFRTRGKMMNVQAVWEWR